MGSSEYCSGWIDWTDLDFIGDVELIIDGSDVTGYADLTAASTIMESDITLESLYGVLQLVVDRFALDYAGYGGLLDFQEESVNTVVDALASELEYEIEWYVDYNCRLIHCQNVALMGAYDPRPIAVWCGPVQFLARPMLDFASLFEPFFKAV